MNSPIKTKAITYPCVEIEDVDVIVSTACVVLFIDRFKGMLFYCASQISDKMSVLCACDSANRQPKPFRRPEGHWAKAGPGPGPRSAG